MNCGLVLEGTCGLGDALVWKEVALIFEVGVGHMCSLECRIV